MNNNTEVTASGLEIEFYINDKFVQVLINPESSALKVIREQLYLTGTKEPCNEGDCGGCTIALGRWINENDFCYSAVNSCILPASRLHGNHIITVEGLNQGKQLHIIQQEMLEKHAVQCGFCTSGFLMSIYCLLVNNSNPENDDISESLEGNLCRCTGYKFINDAVLSVIYKMKNNDFSNKLVPDYAFNVQKKLKNFTKKAILVNRQFHTLDLCKHYFIPNNYSELFSLMSEFKGRFSVINGGTDLMVQGNIRDLWPEILIDISKINSLDFIKHENNMVIVGGNTNFYKLQQNLIIQHHIPVLISAISKLASHQIRNIATLAGNIANASPVADCVCVLLALGSTVVIKSKNNEYKIQLKDFFKEYKNIALDKNSEIISAIEIPFQRNYCNFEKTSKRMVMDIATINSCINLNVRNNKIISCNLALGGVSAIPVLAVKTSDFLIKKELNWNNISSAIDILASEFSPISDVRGTSEYRLLLMKNHLKKHFSKIV